MGLPGRGGVSRLISPARGFSIIELLVVVLVIAVMISAAVIAYNRLTRNTEVAGAAEQIRQELRRVYSMTDSGEKTAGVRHRYRITFNNAGQAPPNAFLVEKSTDGGGSWVAVPVQRGSANITLAGGWARPAAAGDCNLTYSTPTIVFISRGSILETTPAGVKMVTVSSSSTGRTVTITVNDYGSIS